MKDGAPRVQPNLAPAPTPTASAPSSIPDARLYFAKDTYDEIPHDSMRKTIAKRLTTSKRDIPHYYLKVDCNIDTLLDVRKQINDKAPAEGAGAYKLSINDFIVKAAALALIRVPGVNSSWTDTALLRHKHADVGVAVALDFGLITPIVFKAEEKSLAAISREVKDLAVRAKAKKLKPAEFEGGTFAISNLGMFGIRAFTAVINPPHAAILAIGAGEQRAIVKNGSVAVANMMTVQLSCDHRVIDGALGAAWLEAFTGYLENPVTMLA
jgi:pyruvate dehydrogenase E2 component (dihydrolipoamide acetyltransferase)